MGSKRLCLEVDDVIVGAGPVGILHALKQKMAGRSVLVIDRADSIGGWWRGHTVSFSTPFAGIKKNAFFEHGIHLLHHVARWNEALFDLGEEVPVTATLGPSLIFKDKNWKPYEVPESMTWPERAYYQEGAVLVKGGMSRWLESLIEKASLDVRLGQELHEVVCDDDEGVKRGLTPDLEIVAQQWFFSGMPQSYTSLEFPQQVRAVNTPMHYRPAVVMQFVFKRKISDSEHLLVIPHRMDHQEYRFFGFIDSNLDPSRVPDGMQSMSWMCFIDEDHFEDAAFVSRLRRALKRAVAHAFDESERHLVAERFLALPHAGGPVARTQGGRVNRAQSSSWKNVHFATHAAPSTSRAFFWTTQQVISTMRAPSEDVPTQQPQL